jgi:hypothetical protein
VNSSKAAKTATNFTDAPDDSLPELLTQTQAEEGDASGRLSLFTTWTVNFVSVWPLVVSKAGRSPARQRTSGPGAIPSDFFAPTGH